MASEMEPFAQTLDGLSNEAMQPRPPRGLPQVAFLQFSTPLDAAKFEEIPRASCQKLILAEDTTDLLSLQSPFSLRQLSHLSCNAKDLLMDLSQDPATDVNQLLTRSSWQQASIADQNQAGDVNHLVIRSSW